MAKYSVQYKCKHNGCNEWAFTDCNTKADKVRIRNEKVDWLCPRHKNQEEVLKAENYIKITERTLTVQKGGKYDFKHFDNSSSGYIHGLKWRGWVDDFPVGTKIIETSTIQVILPRESSQELNLKYINDVENKTIKYNGSEDEE